MNIQYIHDAVFNLYANALGVSGNSIDEINAIDENENLILVDKNLITTKALELQANEAAKKEEEIAAKESALSKLTALGLTADEVKALLGVA